MSAEEIKKQLNEVDTNKINGLEKYEIEDFLSAPEKVQLLGNEMQEDFDVNNETLQEFKENIGNICKGILENGTITNNQGRILLFYLKYFHNDEDPIGIEIIRNIVYGEEGKINEYITESEDDKIKDINKRFNNLPGVKKIKQQKCMELLELPNLTQEDIKWLEKYKKDYKLGEGMDKEIEEKIELAIANIEISEKVLSNISQNPLENLEKICPGISKIKPNWQLIRQNIKTKDTENIKTEEDIHKLMEKINETITVDNIGEYLDLPEGKTQQDKHYITNNFLTIITQHLILHPGYKIGYGNEPEKLATGITLKDIVGDNELILSAMKKLKESNNRTKGSFDKLSKEEKEKEIKTIIKENNHILFDLRFKKTINLLNEESIREVVEEIIKYSITNYPKILDNFSKNNKYIDNIVQQYKNVKLEESRVEEVKEIFRKAIDIEIPENIRYLFKDKNNNKITSFKFLGRKYIGDYEKYYEKVKGKKGKSKAYNDFCELYETSRNFYKSKIYENGIKEFGLPERISAKDYIEFLGYFQEMKDEVEKLEKESYEMKNIVQKWSDMDSTDINPTAYYYGQQIKLSKLPAVRKYVEIWKKYRPNGEKPDNFIGIKLNRKYSNGNIKDKTDIDKIIRDTTKEGIKDNIRNIYDNVMCGCWQQVTGELIGLTAGIIISGITLAETGSNALAGTTYYLGNKIANASTQMMRDLAIDWLGKRVLGLGKESGANKYDGLDASAGLGLGLYERDKEGNVIQIKTETERIIDTIFGTLSSTLTFYGAPAFKNPVKFAVFEQFLNDPFFNILSSGTKASIGTDNFKGKTIDQVMKEQFSNEFSVEGLQKKAISVIATILLIGLFNETKNTNTNKLKQNIQSHDYDTKDLEKDLKKIPKKEIKKAFKKVLSRMTSQLNKGTGERHQIIVPTLLCTAFKIDSPYLSPDEVIDKKIDKAIEGIKTAENQKEQEIYIKTYIDFITLEECLLNTEDTEIKEKRLLALVEETGITIDKTKVEEAEKRISRQYEKILEESEMVNNMVVEIAQKVESSIEESLI